MLGMGLIIFMCELYDGFLKSAYMLGPDAIKKRKLWKFIWVS